MVCWLIFVGFELGILVVRLFGCDKRVKLIVIWYNMIMFGC